MIPKATLLYTIATTILIFSACTESKKSSTTDITLMSYNVHNGKGMDEVTDYTRIGEFIKRNNPDVVAIQEVDSATRRSSGRDVLAEIAQAAEMYAYFSPSINYDGGKYGIGILSKTPPLNVERFPMPGSEEARSVIIAEFTDYVFACTHLSLTEADRDASVEILECIAKEYDKPFIIAGDFNAEPESKFMRLFTRAFSPLSDITTPTFPADSAEVVIDYIMGANNAGVETLEQCVVDERQLSDHRPIKARVRLTGATHK